jgi:hypothetical protein
MCAFLPFRDEFRTAASGPMTSIELLELRGEPFEDGAQRRSSELSSPQKLSCCGSRQC